MIKHFVYSMLSGLHMKNGLKQLRRLESKLVSPRSRFSIPFSYRGKGYFKLIEPRQNPVEIESLYEMVCELDAQRILEIGTARGGTLYLWLQAALKNATVISVDLPGGEFGGAYPACRIPFYQSFARDDQVLHLLREDSHQTQTFDSVKQLLNDQSIDFLFIDGDHTYEGVKADFEMYAPLVRSGGLIAFHDTLPRPDFPDIEVYRFWDELKAHHDTTDLIGPEGSGKKIGIGILKVGTTGS